MRSRSGSILAAFAVVCCASSWAHAAPRACFTFDPPSPVPLGTPVTFDGRCSFDEDPTKAIVEWVWDFDSDGTFDESGAVVQHTFTEQRWLIVRLQVANDAPIPQNGTFLQDLQVGPALPPVACVEITPNPGVINQPISFDASCSTGLPPLEGLWTDFGGLPGIPGMQTNWSFPTPGSRPARFVLTQGDGQQDVLLFFVDVWDDQCQVDSDCPPDGNDCTDDACVAGTCSYAQLVPNGTSCEDGDDCTMNTVCHADQCVGGEPTDADGDGYVLAGCTDGDDCADGDAAVNPGATEVPFNGKDDDCNLDTPVPGLPGACAAVAEGSPRTRGANDFSGILAVGLALVSLRIGQRRRSDRPVR